MDNILLTNLDKNLTSNHYLFDGNSFDNDLFKFEIESNQEVVITFLNINKEFNIEFIIKENANVKLSFFQENSAKLRIKGQVLHNSTLICYYADFVNDDMNLVSDIDLVGENATCHWNLASLANGNNKKEFDVSLYHKSKKTYCEINNYGVARDKSKLVFTGICKIEHGSHESIAHQNSKIMVFDEESDAIAKPILKIDDNDIEASHAAVVGKISDDHLFYLTSRGLSVDEARELITYGYLKPILNGFDDKTLIKKINSFIEGGF